VNKNLFFKERKEKNKIVLNAFLFLFILSLSTSFILATATYERNTDFDLKRGCFNNGTFCSPSAECNVTIVNPTTDIVLSNAVMTNQGSYHNVTVNGSLTSSLGEYEVFMTCVDGGRSGFETFPFDITPTGEKGNLLGFYIILFTLTYGVTVYGFTSKNEYVAIIGGMFLMILGLYTYQHGIDIYQNLGAESISILTLALGFMATTSAGISLLEDL